MPTTFGTVLLAHQETDQEHILRTGLMSQPFAVRTLRRNAGLIAQLDEVVPEPSRPAVLVLDAARAAAERLSFVQVADYLRVRHPQLRYVLIASRALAVNALHERWVSAHGGLGVFARVSRHRFVRSQRPLLETLAAQFGVELDVDRLKNFAAVLSSAGAIEDDDFADTERAWDQLERAGIDPLAIGVSMLGQWGVISEDKNYRGTTYLDCFTGTDAAQWLNTRLALPKATALLVGEVARATGLFYHITRDHKLKDAHLFYRGNRVTARLRDLDIDAVVDAARSLRGVDIKDRKWRGMAFPRCFVGAAAAQWFMDKSHLRLGEAITLGQCLLDLHVFRHVSDDHDFIDGNFFYRFTLDRP